MQSVAIQPETGNFDLMRGSVSNRGRGKWLVQVYVGQDAAGKWIRPSKVVHGSKRDAEGVLAAMVVENEGYRKPVNGSFGDLVEKWFATVQPDWSPATARETRRIITANLGPLLVTPLAKLTTAEIDACYGTLRVRGLSASTVKRTHTVVHAALEQAVNWDWVDRNVSDRALGGARKRKGMEAGAVTLPVPSANQVVTVLEAAWKEAPRLAAFLTLNAHVGRRRSEVMALRWTDFDRERATLSISRAIVNGPDGLAEKATTKDKRPVLTPLRPETVALLVAHRKRCLEIAMSAGTRLADNAYMFSPEPDGSKPYWPSSLSRAVRLLCQRAGLEPMTVKQLRSFVSTTMVRGGVDITTESAMLGHGTAVALKHYLESSPGDRERAAQVVIDALAAGGAKKKRVKPA